MFFKPQSKRPQPASTAAFNPLNQFAVETGFSLFDKNDLIRSNTHYSSQTGS
jgi:hypothetical protein